MKIAAEDPNVPKTNVDLPAQSFAQMHRMSDEEFGYALQNWHGGGGTGLYSVGSSLGAKHLEIFQNQDAINRALKELEMVYENPKSCYGDRMETIALADELRFRNQKYSGGKKAMNNKADKVAEKWVLANCKFAAGNPQGQMALEMAKKLLPMSRMAPISAPDVMRAVSQGSAGLTMPPGGDMDSFVESVLDGVEGLGGRVARAPAQPQQGMGTPFNANPGAHPHEDPAFQQFRQQKNRA